MSRKNKRPKKRLKKKKIIDYHKIYRAIRTHAKHAMQKPNISYKWFYNAVEHEIATIDNYVRRWYKKTYETTEQKQSKIQEYENHEIYFILNSNGCYVQPGYLDGSTTERFNKYRSVHKPI